MKYPHLERLAQIRATGKHVVAMAYERNNAPILALERRMRAARREPPPRPPTPIIDEITKRGAVGGDIYVRANMLGNALRAERETLAEFERNLPPDAA